MCFTCMCVVRVCIHATLCIADNIRDTYMYTTHPPEPVPPAMPSDDMLMVGVSTPPPPPPSPSHPIMRLRLTFRSRAATASPALWCWCAPLRGAPAALSRGPAETPSKLLCSGLGTAADAWGAGSVPRSRSPLLARPLSICDSLDVHLCVPGTVSRLLVVSDLRLFCQERK